jgi:AAA+ superfamily predicted ATPase
LRSALSSTLLQIISLELFIMHRYEHWIIRHYLANALRASRFAKLPRSDSDVVAWLETHGRSAGLPQPPPGVCIGRKSRRDEAYASIAAWPRWRRALIAVGREAPPSPSPLQRRIKWLALACALSEQQSSAFGLLTRATLSPKVLALVEAISGRYRLDLAVLDSSDLGQLLEGPAAGDELSPDGRLAQLGLIDARNGARLSNVARRILELPRLAARRVGDLLLGEPVAATLGWDDFVHLGEVRELTARMVSAAGGSRTRGRFGVNLLFYGPPGTGKTEFAKTLGAQVDFSVQFVGETNDKNGEPSRSERLAALLIANAIGAVARRTILVVDEADDVFDAFNYVDRRGSKVFLNRLLERSAAPTIWIANDPDRLGSAIVRRMNLVLRFSKPRLSVRKAMVGAIAENHGLRLDEESRLTLARAQASPAAIDNAIRSAALIGGSAGDAGCILQAGLLASGRAQPFRFPTPMPFDPALTSADVDLVALANRVAKSRSLALSFLLSGPPGTGKSAFARHLAERLDLELVEKRYSDLVSMWLGESEKAIALAFEEAADLRAFLVFDEADSLLGDRAAAHHSWEVTQVNEMLTRMERHPYPFACTTNAPELLDAASARRFLFKLRFGALTPSQVGLAYRCAFRCDAPAAIMRLGNLTPGDFAVVVRKAACFGERDQCRIAKWLEEEVNAKLRSNTRRIGF